MSVLFAEAPVSATTATARRKLLLVDGHGSSRAALAYLLRQSGFEVEQAARAPEALAQAQQTRFDAAVLDIALPQMDGLRLLSLLRRDPATAALPAIVVTQDNNKTYVEQCAALGARSYLVKEGLNFDDLVARIRRLTTERREPHAQEAPAQAEPKSNPMPAAARQLESLLANPLGNAVVWERAELPVLMPAALREFQAGFAAGDLDAAARRAELDPALAIELLAAASRGSPVASLVQAVRALDEAMVSETLEKLAARPVGVREGVRPLVDAWWRHAQTVARLAGELAAAAGVDAGAARTAGLLHDLGRLIMLTGPLGERTTRAYDVSRNMVMPTALAEQSLVGVSHKAAALRWLPARGLGESITAIFELHDADDAQRSRLAPPLARLSALVGAADQIAKAAGLGSLFNDELSPLPSNMTRVVEDHCVEVARALEQARSLCLFRGGEAAAASAPVTLAGVFVAFVSPSAGTWNPYRHALARAGARVSAFATFKQALELRETPDAVILDATDATLSQFMPTLRGVCRAANLAAAPKLLLARRSDEAGERLAAEDLPIHVYASPIRIQSMLQAVRRLLGGQE